MISINTNLSSLIAQSSMKKATFSLNQAVERMTTGFKINHAKDNAANYSITTNMTTKINSYMIAQDNVAMGLDMLTTAEENLNLISDKLTRLRDLATQASNGTYGESSLNAINAEANALVDEIERLYNTTEYNGKKLLENKESESVGYKAIAHKDTSNLDKLSEVTDTTNLTSGTYSITTHQELAQLAKMTNDGLIGADCTFILGADIDLSSYENWITIGTNVSRFTAKFDGNGYTISNLKINRPDEKFQGLFGRANGAEISNINLTNAYVQGLRNVGGIAGITDDTKITNCNVEIKIENATDGRIGGVVGGLQDGSIVQNCSTKVEINVDAENVGGLVGFANNNSQILNCRTEGNIYSTSECIGGVAGYADYIQISNTSASCSVWGSSYVGGFAGEAREQIQITNCKSKGIVYSTGERVGGFVGSTTVSTQISNSSASCSVWGFSYVGGFAGVTMGQAQITNCYTDSYVSNVSGETVTSGVFFGGFTGSLQDTASIQNSYATGIIEIKEENNNVIGGFCGVISNYTSPSDVSIEDCYFSGVIKSRNISSSEIVAGFIGCTNLDVTANLTNCYVLGDIVNPTSSFAAVNPGATININNCYTLKSENTHLPSVLKSDFDNPADLSANFTIGECGIEPPFVLDGNNSFNTQLQVGINNSSSSQIEVNWNLDLKFLTNLRAIGENGVNVLSKIEKMATSVQSAQTSIGAVQNRLESALDEIETQYNNLVSSRSTLRDADIAEESSAYIRQQILQEASATLLATANQSPSIALQLI